MLIRQATAATLMTVSLAACGAQSDRPEEPTPEVSPASSEQAPDAQQTVSILRPEIAQIDEPEPPLADLKRVVGFPGKGTDLDAVARVALKEILASPQMALGGAIMLRGHSDAGGADDASLRASEKRAENVRAWMVDNGIEADRITIIAFGDQNPVAPNLKPDGTVNPQGRARNRRVEIEIPVAVIEAGDTEKAGSGESGD